VNVRHARLEDARQLAEIHVETWRATYAGVMPQEVLDGLSVDDREGLWREWIPHAETEVFVAELDGELVGFVSVGPNWSSPDIGELYAIYVLPCAHGSGVGPALLEAATAALARGWDEAILWVATENPRARRFYERHGWVVDGERLDTIAGASVPETRYRLSGLRRR
jgi:ribosomal protein S18 acetylase RimI-like enzyme